MTDTCAVCANDIDWMVDSPIHHEGCGHYAHAGSCCSGDEVYNENCRRCLSAPLPVSTAVELPPQPLDVEPARVGNEGLLGGIFSWVNRASVNLRNRHETPQTSKDVLWLIGLGPTQVPIGLLLQKGFDLNACVRAKVTIDTFLRAGYTIGHLAQFPVVTPEFSPDGIVPLGVKALQALRVTATHLKSNPEQLPMDQVRRHTGLTNKHLVERFWIGFEPTHGIQSAVGGGVVDRQWTIDQLRYLGFDTMDKFINELGLKRASHWHKLEPTPGDIRNLGVTDEHIRLLVNDVAPPKTDAIPVATPTGPQPVYQMRLERDGTYTRIPVVHHEPPPRQTSIVQQKGVLRLDYDRK